MFAWGCNARGQLGLDDRCDRDVPSLVAGLWAQPVVQLAAGAEHSMAVTSHGALFVWGCNRYGQLGAALPGSGEAAARGASAVKGSRWGRCSVAGSPTT